MSLSQGLSLSSKFAAVVVDVSIFNFVVVVGGAVLVVFVAVAIIITMIICTQARHGWQVHLC